MKILIVAGWMYPDQEGGSFRVVYEAGRRLAARGHEIHVVTQRLDERHPEREELAGMAVHRYETTAKAGVRFYISTLRQARRLVDRLQGEVGFDVLQTHHPVSALGAHRARGVRGLPCVAVLHSVYFLEYVDRHTYDARTGARRALALRRRPVAAMLRRLDGSNLRRSERVVVLSEFMRRLVGEHYADCLPRVVKLRGGVDLDRFRADLPRSKARARLGLPDDAAVFFTCRRLEHRMGLVELIEATRRLRDDGRQARVLIAGRGALERALTRLIEEANLGDTVRLLGFVGEEELPLYYRAADCFVLPTRALEGFGLVTAEALACGTPVIGTPVGATPELLEPLDARLVMKDATADGIYHGMRRFLDEIAHEEGLEQRCRAYAEQRFSWDAFANGLEQISRELAEP